MEKHFLHETNVGIFGHGETIEACFIDIAKSLFSLMTDLSQVHQIQVLSFEFEAPETEVALMTWLNLLIAKAKEHHLLIGDFRLHHEEGKWKATISGEPWPHSEQELMIKKVISSLSAIKKVGYTWEACCVVEISP